MVAATYDAAMIRVFADEGGYTDDPADPGGPTNWGITIFDARKYWKATATALDVKGMPKSVAADIFRKRYAAPMRYDDLPAGFDYSVLDAAINSGVGRAPQWACKALGIPVTSISGVVAPANTTIDKVKLIQKYWDIRLGFLQGLTTWSHFGLGWGRRCANGEAAAVRMWLTIGAALPSADANATMKTQADKAKKSSTKAGTVAAGTGTGTTIAVPSLDLAHLSFGGKLLLCAATATVIMFVIYLIRRAIIHSQRAAAYAAA